MDNLFILKEYNKYNILIIIKLFISLFFIAYNRYCIMKKNFFAVCWFFIKNVCNI